MINNTLLAYVRTQEDSADRAGVNFLNATGQSAKGMHDSFKRLADQILYQTRYVDPYMQSHPMPAERVRALEQLARSSPHWDKKDSPALQQRHDMMRAKLFGFTDTPESVFRRYPASDNSLRSTSSSTGFRRRSIDPSPPPDHTPDRSTLPYSRGSVLISLASATAVLGVLRRSKIA
jgi:predicted Zn-dependent protease